MRRFSSILTTGVLALAIASCSESVREGCTPVFEGVKVTVHATRGDNTTRSVLSEKGGDLSCAWQTGDQLIVTNTDGGKLGVLALTDEATGKFEGSLVGLTEGRMNLNYFFLGTGVDGENISQNHTFDLSSQDGKLESLGKYDALSASAEITVIKGKTYVNENLQLGRHFAFAHFTLTFPEDVTTTGVTFTMMTDVTVTITGLDTKATLGFTDRALSEVTAGTVTVNGTDGDIYVNIIPGKDVSPTFKATVNGKEYEGSLGPRDITAGVYLRKAARQGVPVEMTAVGGDEPVAGTDAVGPEFEIDGKKYRLTSGNLYYNTKTGVWSLHDRQTDYTNAGGLDLAGETTKTPELIGLFSWGATGLADAQKPTTLRDVAWRPDYGGVYFPTTSGQNKNNSIKTLWSYDYAYDWGRAYAENGRPEGNTQDYRTPSTDVFTKLLTEGFVQGATVKGAADDGSDVVGLIVIPDVKTLAEAKGLIGSVEGASCLSNMQNVLHNNGGNTFNYNSITIQDYDAIRKLNDAVFFPAASKRNLNGGTVYNSDGKGWYWSSTSNTTTNAKCLYFDGKSGGFYYDGNNSSSMGRFNQMAVRLLVEVK